MSPNNGILLNVLRPKLLNIPFASCSFLDLDFLLPHTAHFDDSIALPFLVFNNFGSTFFVSFLHFKEYVNKFYNDLCLTYERFRINLVLNSFFTTLLF